MRTSILRLLDHPRAPRAIIGAGLALRVVALVLLARIPLDGDAQSYHETATYLTRGEPYEPHWPPGLSTMLAAAFALFGESELVSRVVMLPVYLGFCAALLAVGARLVGMRATNLTLAVLAIKPIFVWTSVTPLSQLPTATLALVVVHFADQLRRERRPASTALVFGLSLAVMVLTRPSSASVVVALPFYLFWRTRRWQTLAIPLAVVALFVGAWAGKAYAMTGRLIFINNANSQNIFYGNNPWTPTYRTWWYGSHKEQGDMDGGFGETYEIIHRLDPMERDGAYMKVVRDHLRARPDLFVLRTASRVRVFMSYDTFTSAQFVDVNKALAATLLVADVLSFLFLTGFAIAFPAARRAGLLGGLDDTGAAGSAERREGVRILVLVAAAYAAPYYVTLAHPTFHFPIAPLLGLLGSAACVAMLESGARAAWDGLTPRDRVALPIALAAFAAVQIEWTIDVASRLG